MADVNPTPTPDPIQIVDHPPDLCIFCFRDWCQGQAARVQMIPTDYSKYMQITRNYFNQVTLYDQFQKQLKTLLEHPDKEYRHLQPYWDVFHRGYIEKIPVEDNPLFFYPIDLCRRLNRIPGFDFFSDPEQGKRIREHNRIEAKRINAQIKYWRLFKPPRKRNAPKLKQAVLEGAADNKVEAQTDTPKRRPYRKRKAPNLEQAPLKGTADIKVEIQTGTPQKRPYRKRSAPKLEQAPPQRRS